MIEILDTKEIVIVVDSNGEYYPEIDFVVYNWKEALEGLQDCIKDAGQENTEFYLRVYSFSKKKKFQLISKMEIVDLEDDSLVELK